MQDLRPADPRDLGLNAFLPPLLLGFLASSFQIILLREFSVCFYGNELTLGLVLASWLLWAGLGSLLGSRRPARGTLAGRYESVILIWPLALGAVRLSRFAFRVLPGEPVGLSGAALAALAAGLLVSFPLGRLFADNVKAADGRLSRVYVLESLGAAAAGFFLQGALLPRLSNWSAAAAAGVFGLVLVHFFPGPRRVRILSLAGVAALAALAVYDQPSQRLYWRPFSLAGGRDTRYGRLQVVRTGEQVTFYANGARMFTRPEAAAGEDAVHFAMLQDKPASRVLLVGGGVGGSLDELLKYPGARVDYVELDPGIIGLARRHLDPGARRAIDDPRVSLFFEDGRSYLLRTGKTYDVIIIDLPGPATAQLNRFYTREFFELAERRLAAGGVFSFGAVSSENYIGAELGDLLACLFRTVTDVFPNVKVVPGDRNIFLASAGRLSIEPEELERRRREIGVETIYVGGAILRSRLHPLRIRYLEERLAGGAGRLNTDLRPVAFFLESLLWSRQFGGAGTGVLRRLADLPVPLLLALPAAFLMSWLGFACARRPSGGCFLAPVVLLGWTSIIVEVVMLVWFQSVYGYLYGRIAALLSSFMFGLFAGAWASSRARGVRAGRLSALSLGVVVLLAVFLADLSGRPPAVAAFLILFTLGALGGDIFITANRLHGGGATASGLGYGLELLGSFLGAVATSSLLIPVAGLKALTVSVLVLNLAGLVFLLTRLRTLGPPAAVP